MKIQLTILFFLMFAIISFGQNLEEDSEILNQIINPLPTNEIKYIEYEKSRRLTDNGLCSCGKFICWHNPNDAPVSIRSFRGRTNVDNYSCAGRIIILKGTEAYLKSSSTNYCSVIIDNSKQIKKRYTALKERHNSRYPNNNALKTPELQSTLQEIRF